MRARGGEVTKRAGVEETGGSWEVAKARGNEVGAKAGRHC